MIGELDPPQQQPLKRTTDRPKWKVAVRVLKFVIATGVFVYRFVRVVQVVLSVFFNKHDG